MTPPVYHQTKVAPVWAGDFFSVAEIRVQFLGGHDSPTCSIHLLVVFGFPLPLVDQPLSELKTPSSKASHGLTGQVNTYSASM